MPRDDSQEELVVIVIYKTHEALRLQQFQNTENLLLKRCKM